MLYWGMVIMHVCATQAAGIIPLTSEGLLMKASWIPTSYGCQSAETIYSTFSALKEEGISRVYMDVWNSGKVYFKSPTMEALSPNSIGPDYLQWALDAGKELGIEVFAWFEYGLMTSYGGINNDFAQYAESNGWMLGEYGSFYWMDPENEEVLNFIAGILTDALDGYASASGLLGVQLDDHFSSPVKLGRSTASMDNAMNFVRSALRQHSPENAPLQTQYNGFNGSVAYSPSAPSAAEFATNASARTGTEFMLSLSPSTLDQALNTYNVDWNRWGELNYFDEVIPQLYRTSFASFQDAFEQTVSGTSAATQLRWSACGLRVDGSGDPTQWDDVSLMIKYCNTGGGSSSAFDTGESAAAGSEREGGYEVHPLGVSIWYAHGILELYPEEFKALWT